jgi:hypothetical protein
VAELAELAELTGVVEVVEVAGIVSGVELGVVSEIVSGGTKLAAGAKGEVVAYKCCCKQTNNKIFKKMP